MHSITEYVTAKSLSRGDVEVRRDLTEEFIQGQIELFPNVPKGHFMLHYCDQILELGPLVHLWTMRFKAKHQQFLDIRKPIACSKNLCKSFATRHQYANSLHSDTHVLFLDTLSLLKPKSLKVGEINNLLNNTLARVLAEADDAVVMGTGLRLNSCVFGLKLFCCLVVNMAPLSL